MTRLRLMIAKLTMLRLGLGLLCLSFFIGWLDALLTQRFALYIQSHALSIIDGGCFFASLALMAVYGINRVLCESNRISGDKQW